VHAELVAQAKRGDHEAFDSLARLTGDGCMAIAFRILRDYDLADDAVQSALLTAWREIRTLRDPRLRPNTGFTRFARLTASIAGRLYGVNSEEQKVVQNGWKQVGIG